MKQARNGRGKAGSKPRRGTITKRLGLPDHDGLTRKVCQEKSRLLAKNIEAGKYSGDLRRYAVYYKNWYGWKARNM